VKLNIPSFTDSKLHQFTDQIEIYLMFFHANDSISSSDLQSLVDKDVESVRGATDDAIDEIYSQTGRDPEELDVIVEEKASTCISYIRGRSEKYDEFYPFEVTEEGRVIRKCDLTGKHQLYLFLLQCSALNLIDQKADSIKLANSFEYVCATSLSQWIPRAEVKEFGPTSVDRRDYFGQNTRDALVKLASFINATPIQEKIFKTRVNGDFQVSHSGDKGLDLIAKIPFAGDDSLGSFVIFGQCASRKNHWWHKKHEADPVELSTYMSFNSTPVNMVFIPVCFRDSDGSWFDEGKASGGCIVVDRLRICSMFRDYDGGYEFVPELASIA
jgi:hypothetical protein